MLTNDIVTFEQLGPGHQVTSQKLLLDVKNMLNAGSYTFHNDGFKESIYMYMYFCNKLDSHKSKDPSPTPNDLQEKSGRKL